MFAVAEGPLSVAPLAAPSRDSGPEVTEEASPVAEEPAASLEPQDGGVEMETEVVADVLLVCKNVTRFALPSEMNDGAWTFEGLGTLTFIKRPAGDQATIGDEDGCKADRVQHMPPEPFWAWAAAVSEGWHFAWAHKTHWPCAEHVNPNLSLSTTALRQCTRVIIQRAC